MAIISAGSATPPGTPPQPVRRSTKHKQPAYGRELLAKAVTRRLKRAAKKAAAAAEAGKKTQAAASAAAKAARK